ncbi:FxLD family lanthipeptide [Streptomyces sp. NPDC127084]
MDSTFARVNDGAPSQFDLDVRIIDASPQANVSAASDGGCGATSTDSCTG